MNPPCTKIAGHTTIFAPALNAFDELNKKTHALMTVGVYEYHNIKTWIEYPNRIFLLIFYTSLNLSVLPNSFGWNSTAKVSKKSDKKKHPVQLFYLQRSVTWIIKIDFHFHVSLTTAYPFYFSPPPSCWSTDLEKVGDWID